MARLTCAPGPVPRSRSVTSPLCRVLAHEAVACVGVVLATVFIAVTGSSSDARASSARVEAAAGSSAPRFSAPVSVRTGKEPDRPVAADFNRDGKLDLATANYRSHSVSIFTGRGDGSFDRRVSISTTRYPGSLVAADVNRDGSQDLILASNDRARSVMVLTNDGSGTLHPGQTYRVGMLWIDAADVNGDGFVDIVGNNDLGGGLAVLLGSPGGTFLPARRLDGKFSYEVHLGDLNRDGKLDVAFVTNDHFVIRLGNGDGAFGPGRSWDTGGDNVLGLTLADLNGDGNLDVATANTDSNDISIFLGRGDGSFGARAAYRMGEGPTDVLVADFNADGEMDIASSSLYRDPAVRTGRGDGTFDKRQLIPWFDNAFGMVADFNQDGRPDLAFVGGEGGVLASVFLNWTGLPAPPCVVLNVTSWRLRTAERYFRYGGCKLGKVTFKYSQNVRKSRVISQRPNWGTVLPSGSSVDVVVSRGRRR